MMYTLPGDYCGCSCSVCCKKKLLRKKRRTLWCKQWLFRQPLKGSCNEIFLELQVENPADFENYRRMPILHSIHCWQKSNHTFVSRTPNFETAYPQELVCRLQYAFLQGDYFKGRGGGGFRGRGRGYDSGSSLFNFDPNDVFQIRRPQTFSGDAEILQKPTVLGGYSVDSDRKFSRDQSMLHFLDTKYISGKGKMKVRLDLNKGEDKFIRYTGNPEETFQNFLRWIIDNQKCVSESSDRLTADFVSVRGNFTKMMRTPYNFVSPWTMYATEFKGSVYIIKWLTEDDMAEKNNVVVDDVTRWGHVFEHYMKGGDPEKGVEANEEYRVVLKSQIGKISLLYAPEVDCVDPELFEEDFKDMEAFVLVKCRRELTESKKRFKLNQLWVETQLAGIPRIIVGYRNDDGIVHTLEHLEADDLPVLSEGEWDPNVCFNFLVKFLNFVKERVHREPGTTFRFVRKAKGHVYCTKLSGKDHINLLPSWYTDGLFAEDSDDES